MMYKWLTIYCRQTIGFFLHVAQALRIRHFKKKKKTPKLRLYTEYQKFWKTKYFIAVFRQKKTRIPWLKTPKIPYTQNVLIFTNKGAYIQRKGGKLGIIMKTHVYEDWLQSSIRNFFLRTKSHLIPSIPVLCNQPSSLSSLL